MSIGTNKAEKAKIPTSRNTSTLYLLYCFIIWLIALMPATIPILHQKLSQIENGISS
jgi:hypothetical protein